jgi:hypothetical protein
MMGNRIVRLGCRLQSSTVCDPVGRESWYQSHLRRFEVGKVVRMLELERVWKRRCLRLIEMRRIEGLCGAHAEGPIVRNLVVLVEEVVGVDIVGGCGNRGIDCSRGHSEKLVCGMLEERRERRKRVV